MCCSWRVCIFQQKMHICSIHNTIFLNNMATLFWVKWHHLLSFCRKVWQFYWNVMPFTQNAILQKQNFSVEWQHFYVEYQHLLPFCRKVFSFYWESYSTKRQHFNAKCGMPTSYDILHSLEWECSIAITLGPHTQYSDRSLHNLFKNL